jgi:hypothetical protein
MDVGGSLDQRGTVEYRRVTIEVHLNRVVTVEVQYITVENNRVQNRYRTEQQIHRFDIVEYKQVQ